MEGECGLLSLRDAGHTLHRIANLAQVLAITQLYSPDLLLVEWASPENEAIEMMLALRASKSTQGLPIIVLSLDGDAHAKIAALEAGADDYVVQPCHAGELHARIRAVLRRYSPRQGDEVIQLNGLYLDPLTQGVKAQTATGSRAIQLSSAEFRLLHFLMVHPQQVHSRALLLERVWGKRFAVSERTVDVHMCKLRVALAGTQCDEKIQTVRGRGYCLVVGAGAVL